MEGRSVNRWLIAFDVRSDPEQYVSRRWDATRRARYLLRPEVQWRLSVDGLVWPSVFRLKGLDQLSDSPIEIDPDVAGGDPWRDLDRLRACYDAHRAPAPDGVFIGVELLSEREAEAQTLPYVLPGGIQAAVWLEPTCPERLPEGSTLLGYDVADAHWVSGLANSAYEDQEIRALAPSWAARLNSFGLIDTLDVAIAFREVCDARLPGHVPFWIYALWRLSLK
jgi:hypothetical protein